MKAEVLLNVVSLKLRVPRITSENIAVLLVPSTVGDPVAFHHLAAGGVGNGEHAVKYGAAPCRPPVQAVLAGPVYVLETVSMAQEDRNVAARAAEFARSWRVSGMEWGIAIDVVKCYVEQVGTVGLLEVRQHQSSYGAPDERVDTSRWMGQYDRVLRRRQILEGVFKVESREPKLLQVVLARICCAASRAAWTAGRSKAIKMPTTAINHEQSTKQSRLGHDIPSEEREKELAEQWVSRKRWRPIGRHPDPRCNSIPGQADGGARWSGPSTESGLRRSLELATTSSEADGV